MDLSLLHRTHDRPTVRAKLLGMAFDFMAGNGLFSADRVDDGTRLLLQHLPSAAPTRVLDVGCGYGALGLPIAALHKGARVELVDRDLIAVEYATQNANAHQLSNVSVHPSLGYREVAHSHYDWIVCNVPARIGDAGVRYLLREGARRLTERGVMLIVVISALGKAVTAAASAEGLILSEVATGKNHMVYSVAPSSLAPGEDHEDVYVRDTVAISDLNLERPHDISEAPLHMREAIPLMLDVLPRRLDGKKALIVRGGYGIAAVTLLARGAEVVAADHDLMNLTFTARNARHASALTVLPSAWPFRAVHEEMRFDLIVVEVSERAGAKALQFEVPEARRLLTERGEVIYVGLKKSTDEAFSAIKKGPRALATRGAFAVYRDTR